MKPPPFEYHDPHTVEQTLRLLADLDGAKVLAGGQSLMPMLNMRLAYPEHVVDINRVAGLDGTAYFADQRVLRIGALTRQRVVENDPLVGRHFPLLPEALGHVGHFQTRNRGTVGGSIAHSDSTAELVAVASAADATIHAASMRGLRAIPMSGFARNHFTTELRGDELLVAVDLPVWGEGHGYAFEEFARRHGDFAVVAVAVLLELADGTIRRCAIGLVGLGAVPVRATEAEALLTGAAATDDVLDRAAAAAEALPASGDDAAPAEYRRALAATLARRALRHARDRADESRPTREVA